MKKGKRMKICCIGWQRAVDSIIVDARDIYNPVDNYKAKTLQELLKYTMGNYCPTCGNKF